ncbi:MAG: hypothetical protein KAT30_04915, partial [Candidatus Krumholzibacteria bacterium]|nr:hypothetical protein [Candidatus Krumholzibacteria bacterium]
MLRYRKLFFVIILLAFCLSISLQCSDDAVAPEPDPEPPTQNSVSKTIDQNGGTVALDSEAWVIIPPGALDSALVITITRIADALNPPANYISRGASYGFTPHSYTFNDSVTIGITYEPDTVLAAPSMVKLDSDADNSWETVPGARCVAGTVIYKSLTFSILSVNSFQPLEEVYVSIFSQGPSAAGTRGDPLPTISAGIAAAQGAGQPYPPVLVATGTYEESLVLADGVSIQGGLDPETWEFPAEPIEYSVVDLNTTAASAAGITHTTSIAGLVLS